MISFLEDMVNYYERVNLNTNPKIVLFGGTDLTLAITTFLVENGTPPLLCIGVDKSFSISYNHASINSRYAPLEDYCKANKITFWPFTNFKDISNSLKDLNPDIGFAVGWYHMIPSYIRDIFSYGVLGIHASLLPELRGGAPLGWSILLNKSETGISLFKLTDGVDDGLICGQKKFSISSTTTVTDLIELCEVASLELIENCLINLKNKDFSFMEQTGIPTYCLQRIPEDGRILWSQYDSDYVDRLVRATTRPYPGAFTYHKGTLIRIWKAQKAYDPIVFGTPGQIFCQNGRVFIVCQQGTIEILEAYSNEEENFLPVLLKSSHQRLQEKL